MIYSFLLGFVSVALVALLVLIFERRKQRRHQVGLAAAQEWARSHAEMGAHERFGQCVGEVYRGASTLGAAAQSDPSGLTSPKEKCARMRGAVSVRMLATGLSLSAAAFVGLVVHESYTPSSVIPAQGDVPTLGFGSTVHENGAPVKMGETTTPVRALIKAQAHIGKDEAVFRSSLPGVALHQGEYDLYMDWVYQYGTAAWSRSDMRRQLQSGSYRRACDAMLDYRKMTSTRKEGPGWVVNRRDAAGRPTRWEFDCSTPGNKVCMGVWTRQVERHKKCVDLQ